MRPSMLNFSFQRFFNSVAYILLLVYSCGGLRSVQKCLTESQYSYLSSLSNISALEPRGHHLRPFLRPRVSGTEGNRQVAEFIVEFFTKLQWHVDLDTFTAPTPHGPCNFSNIIVTQNHNSLRNLIMAAHYDSKYFPDPNEFVGATDSAGPCAILLDLALSLTPLLSSTPNSDHNVNLMGLQFIFFDGEEAFVDWSATDSLYGSRHLANSWHQTRVPPATHLTLHPSRTLIDKMDCLILLDLLGSTTPWPQFHNYFPETSEIYTSLLQLEQRLLLLGMLSKTRTTHSPASPYFAASNLDTNIQIDDDHRPFMDLGVPVLHLIPLPFPVVWHKLSDDASIIDSAVLADYALILRIFIVEYLDVPVDAGVK